MDVLPLPPVEYVRQRLDYDPTTGLFRWREMPRVHFRSDRLWNSYNTRWAGREAFTCVSDSGIHGRIDGKLYYAHRIAWLIHHGVEPRGEIDHINGDFTDNRMGNLRDVSRAMNRRNLALVRGSGSPYHGVHFRFGKWRVVIEKKSIGSFDDIEAAIAARRNAEAALGYHPNHGRAPKPKNGQQWRDGRQANGSYE